MPSDVRSTDRGTERGFPEYNSGSPCSVTCTKPLLYLSLRHALFNGEYSYNDVGHNSTDLV
jgi:hypothetical protein